MELKEAYVDRVLGEVEDLSFCVLELNGRFARQQVRVKLEHYGELAYVRTWFPLALVQSRRRGGASCSSRTF